MLPKIQYPIYKITIPSTKKQMSFRPFLVKEEKLLLMAKEQEDSSEYLAAIKQVVNNCCLEQPFDIDKLALFDLEYLFLKLRAFSVDNIIKVSYVDNEDDKTYDFEIDLNKIEVEFPEKISNVIKITDNIGIIMKYPSAALYGDKEFLNTEKEYMFELILKCIDKIYEGDSVFEAKNYKKEELSNFLENLSLKVFEEVNDFLINVPKMRYVINYKNSLNNNRKITLESLSDFFT